MNSIPVPPSLDLQGLLDLATKATSARMFLAAGGGILVLSLLLNMAIEIWKTVGGQQERINYATPIGRVLFFAILLGFYGAVVTNILTVTDSLGTMDGASTHASVFSKRVYAFQNTMQAHSATSGYFSNPLNFDNIKLALIEVITWLTYLFTLGLVYVFKYLQTFTLAAIINYGPILIGFASLGTIFGNLALSWFWALVETAFWGVTMNILLATFDRVPIKIGDEASSAWTEITINLVFAVCIASVPALTSSLIRGSNLSALGNKAAIGLMAVGGIAMKSVQGASGAAVAAGAPIASKGLEAAGRAAEGAGNAYASSRLGDAMVGALAQASMGMGGKGGGAGDAARSRARHFAISKGRKGD